MTEPFAPGADNTFAPRNSALGRLALQGKRVAMVSFSPYPADPRPRRAAEALLKEGMAVDIICLADGTSPRRERGGALDILRLGIKRRRRGKLSYAYQYLIFLLAVAAILALRSLRRRYHLVYVHNMPDILVFSSVAPKALGAKVILDQHDPMPELMTTIFGAHENGFSIQLLRWLERWSFRWADSVITVNIACKRIFSSRSCDPKKIGVVMNAPDASIFGFRPAREQRNGRFVIMYHGSIVHRNGLDLAIEALARVKHSIPSAELRIYGERTAFLDEVLSQARSNGIDGCVHYLGPKRLEDLVPEIACCDVGLIPNQRNAFTGINTPTRIFEYLALGKPVIAPRTLGIEDYFGPGSLLFFEPGNAEELASQIQSVFVNPRGAAESARLGQEVYLSHTWSRERETLVQIVGDVLAGC